MSALTVRVAVDSGVLSVTWAAPVDDAATYAHARIFLTGVDGERDFLGVIAPGATLTVDTVAGTYTATAESYSSGSWGGGRLSGLGRSAEFTVGK
ncbi:hypothetical protein GII33_20460 [Gordonia pseudamarae]|jgi:hypothetical protein|uniref:Fibronectin type III domain-containing protein n=1 Tax=Gordonia pseudamarae TaxID=2831662 RepID=A0ABX6IP04_9ACTN|nr:MULTISPECIES: hypothetical protein [Gordonia]MBD0021883.1 hypothetical protein [Gordonia sp. (in: high G+C Gram-positive bacteria)]QHN27993.1 hypothetical protein GII33_20460 [Gordonia pseudamarae]QHN36851.1 hypothetical protein GII31_20080 [Gordonia pseudamarae]